MLRSVLGKAMWVGRTTAAIIGLAIALAVVFGGTTMALAAVPGDPLKLGKLNTIDAMTRLVGTNSNVLLKITNEGSGSALGLEVKQSAPPMRVNSDKRVPNLNADRVDNKSANDLSRVAVMNTAASKELPADGSLVTYGQQLSISAPAAGFVRVNGNVTVQNEPSNTCTSGCQFDAYVRHINSESYSVAAADGAFNTFGNAGLDAVFPVNAGVNTFDIRLRRSFSGGNGKLHGWFGVLTAEYTPYGSTGTGTLSASGLAAASEGPISKE